MSVMRDPGEQLMDVVDYGCMDLIGRHFVPSTFSKSKRIETTNFKVETSIANYVHLTFH